MPNNFRDLRVIIRASADMAFPAQVIMMLCVGLGFIGQPERSRWFGYCWLRFIQQAVEAVDHVLLTQATAGLCDVDGPFDDLLIMVKH